MQLNIKSSFSQISPASVQIVEDCVYTLVCGVVDLMWGGRESSKLKVVRCKR